MRVDSGADLQADNMGKAAAGDTGTSTAVGTTSLTDSGKSWTVNGWTGRVVFTGSVYGVVLSNTATVLTIDKWYTPATPGGAAASNPATGAYVIGTAYQPASWIALTENATAPATTDTTLTAELTGAGLKRALATYSHTAAATSYQLSNTFTCAAGDTPPKTPAKIGVFNASSAGRMAFETLISSAPTLLTSDTLTITETVTI